MSTAISSERPPRRVAVFRALQLGDMLCAVPALRAMRKAWPRAEITLIGLPGAQAFTDRFSGYISDLMPFPGVAEFPEQAREFDLAIQMHGTGQTSNSIVRGLGAARCAGFVPDSAFARPGRFMAWPDTMPEPLRYTSLMRFMGIPVPSEQLEFPLTRDDRREARALQARLGFDVGATVLLHPGARLPSRRWPVGRFAAVGRALAEHGWRLAVTGSGDESFLTRPLLAALPANSIDLTGQTSLGGLAALLAGCPLLICNDTGVSHIAAAMATPSVVVASGSDVARWAPLDTLRHTVLSFQVPCRPCAYHDCPIGHLCALGVPVGEVVATAYRKLEHAWTNVPLPAGSTKGSKR
jgi:ADP-heptose:LPS heptosyltransferase